MPIFKIGAFSLPLIAGLDVDQEYEMTGGDVVHRAISGVGLKQETWGKLRVVTRGSGWVPAGLASVNTKVQQVIGCIKARSVPVVFATRQATLPAARRSDAGHLPWGLAMLSSGTAVNTAATLVGDVATLAAVPGAVSYCACYYPEITAWVHRPRESGSPSAATHAWEIVAEEV